MIGKILTRLFALFGMTLTCVACYGVPDTEFRPEFTATGRVVDPKGNAIEGIEVSIGKNKSITNPNGRFYIGGNTQIVDFRDVDGELNGEFEDRYIELGETNNIVELGDVELTRK